MHLPGGDHSYWDGKKKDGDDSAPSASAPVDESREDHPGSAYAPDDGSSSLLHQQPVADSLPLATDLAEDPPVSSQLPDTQTVGWEASEFIDHSKSASWFLTFGIFVVALLLLSIFVLHDWFMVIGSAIMCVAIGVVGVRKPRILHYVLDQAGVHIGERVLGYGQFHSFGVVHEGGLWSVLLRPTARFKPMLAIYFEESQGEKIVDVLSKFLPMEDYKSDAVDRLSRKLHF